MKLTAQQSFGCLRICDCEPCVAGVTNGQVISLWGCGIINPFAAHFSSLSVTFPRATGISEGASVPKQSGVHYWKWLSFPCGVHERMYPCTRNPQTKIMDFKPHQAGMSKPIVFPSYWCSAWTAQPNNVRIYQCFGRDWQECLLVKRIK